MKDDHNKPRAKFDVLDERVIAETAQKPIFSIKTNLDQDDPTEDNPYFDKEEHYSKENVEKFKNFFEGR